MANEQLTTYLNDHLGGSKFGVQHAQNSASRYEGTPLGDTFAQLAEEIGDDIDTLKSLMDALGIPVHKFKRAGAAIGERLLRLKANGNWIGRSPLDRLLDLEILSLGIEGKHVLWVGLGASGVKADGFDFAALAEAAEDQRARLEAHRPKAAAEALTGS